MKRILVAVLLSIFILAPACAEPLYAGIQLDDTSLGGLLGYQIDKKYAVEVHYSRADSRISHAGLTVDSTIIGIGVVGIALFPMKLNDVLPYSLFAKAGYERTTNNETYSIPTSVTLTLPYNDNINTYKNQFIFGGGAEYGFSKNVMGRLGVDFLGKDRSINLGAIYKF
jgi:hypothetical protein